MTIIYPMFVINETDVRFYISLLSKNAVYLSHTKLFSWLFPK